MKTNKFYLVIGLISLLYLGFTNNSDEEFKKRNKSIIKFSHEFHIEMGECVDCHTKVTESIDFSESLLPVKDDCATCHDVEDDENCSTCHYEDVYEALIPNKAGVIFNHKFHLEDQKLNCMNCHSGIALVEYSFESESAKPSMALCVSCHNNTSVATNNCQQCHVSTDNLIPDNHLDVGFFKNHKFANEEECAMCHQTEVFCEDCHNATVGINESNLSNDFYTPYKPHSYVDGVKQQVITRVHDLNFRFTHGIEAKGKTSNCQSCHQTETFCAECHASEDGDFAMGGIVPLSHTSPNFLTGLTPGSDHAILAKRDIESCAACHDTQGADPNCMMCHTDADGVQGTNPKTHDSGFMKNVHGDWHDDGGSVCFNCHTNTNVAGVGFCNYCHGADAD